MCLPPIHLLPGQIMANHLKSEKIKFIIPALDCPQCASQLMTGLKKQKGITETEYDLIAKSATISYQFSLISPQDISAYLTKQGYPPEQTAQPHRCIPFHLISTAVSGFLAVTGTVLGYLGFPAFPLIIILSTAILLGGYQIAYRGLRALVSLRLDINFLMTVAVAGAIIIGEWSEGAVVIVLFSLAELIESYSVGKVRRAVESLLQFTPSTANLLASDHLPDANPSDGSARAVPVESVHIGDLILIKSGERIPLDGIILKGRSHIDQSTITGEPLPALKQEGDEVFAGTLNGEGALTMRVVAGYRDTTLARIVSMVEQAQAKRAKAHRFVDRFASWYTPLVVAGAVLIAILPPLFFGADWLNWIYRALVLLVISCPCALVISTPVTIVSALSSAARNGLLIKGGIHLETIRKIKAIALDKTGTLTVGRPQVSAVIPYNTMDKKSVLTIAASLEAGSEHHLACAIQTYAQEEGIAQLPINSFKSIPGRGVSAEIDGKSYILGNHPMVEEWGWCDHRVHDELSRQIAKFKTAVLLASEEGVLGIIAFDDNLREGTAETVERLRGMGIEHLVMLTGDNQGSAEEFARRAGISEERAGLLPQAKAEVVVEMRKKYGPVMMVGDGVNDAPALVSADVGVAMGAAGSAVALENADVALMGDDLKKLPLLIALSRRAMHIVTQNITLAIAIKAVFLALAFSGLATLWMAVFADMGASIIVILNGMRCLSPPE